MKNDFEMQKKTRSLKCGDSVCYFYAPIKITMKLKGLDVDESAILLQDMHKKIVEFAGFLHMYIDFDKAFEPEEAGVINLAQRKDKATYKKFCINEY